MRVFLRDLRLAFATNGLYKLAQALSLSWTDEWLRYSEKSEDLKVVDRYDTLSRAIRLVPPDKSTLRIPYPTYDMDAILARRHSRQPLGRTYCGRG